MAIEFYYVCVSAKTKKIVRDTEHNGQFVLADLQFENEHGQQLAPLVDVLVCINDNQATMVQYIENHLDTATPEKIYNELETLAENHPGYFVYNEEEFSKYLTISPLSK